MNDEQQQQLKQQQRPLDIIMNKPATTTTTILPKAGGWLGPYIIVFLAVVVMVIGYTVIRLSVAIVQQNNNHNNNRMIDNSNASSENSNTTMNVFDHNNNNKDKVVYGLQPDCFVQDTEDFHICFDLRSQSGQVEPWMEAFGKAKRRWEQVIVADNWPSVTYQWEEHTGIKVDLEIDDTIILVENDLMDGVGGIVATSIPANMFQVLGNDDGVNHTVPRGGWIKFDSADIEDMMKQGEDWENSILHEVGHVLGIGHMWVANGLYNEQEGVYTGKAALKQWKLLGCTGPLPVETNIGEGTDHGHWDEQCLKSELMTGLKPAPGGAGDNDHRAQKLSAITIGSLEDLGYIVDYSAADPFDFTDLGYCSTYCPNPDNGESSVGVLQGNDDDMNGGGLRRRRRTTSMTTTTLSQPKVVPTEQERIQMLQGAAKLFQTIPSSFASSTRQDSLIIYYKHDNGSIQRHLIHRDEARRYL